MTDDDKPPRSIPAVMRGGVLREPDADHDAIHARDVHGFEKMQCAACRGGRLSGAADGSMVHCKMCLNARVITVIGRNPYRCGPDCPLALPEPPRDDDEGRF